MKTKRFLLKLSGEVLKGDKDSGLSLDLIDKLCKRLAPIIKNNVQLGIVVGGGNIFRGASNDISKYNRCIGDQIGMMSTVINGLALKERFDANGISALLQSGIKVEGIADLFDRDIIEKCFSKNGVVIFCGGTGNPFFSTDTTAALRALQIDADFLFKATKVDGIYDKDPVKFKDAHIYEKINYDQIIKQELQVMDLTAVLLLKTNRMKLRVFNMIKPDILEKACSGENIGTLVEE
ncbi:MAG: UMP kinase [Spirochaetes bacterium]|nr:UMP kinase [Spirochaetota bacterium]